MKKINYLFPLIFFILVSCKETEISEDKSTPEKISSLTQQIIHLNKYVFKEAKLSFDNKIIAAVTESPTHHLVLIDVSDNTTTLIFEGSVADYQFTGGNDVYFIAKEFTPNKKNILMFYDFSVQRISKLKESDGLIELLKVNGEKAAVTINGKVVLYEKGMELPDLQFNEALCYSLGNKLVWHSSKDNGKFESVEEEDVIWSDCNDSAAVYYLKNSGLVVKLPDGSERKIGEYFYPELSPRGNLLLAVSEKYEERELTSSSVRIFVIYDDNVELSQLFIEEAYKPHWFYDGKGIIYIDEKGNIVLNKITKKGIL